MIKRESYVFTSESVGEGHPDKICDQISDAVLDNALTQDADSRVACETFITTGFVLVGGEITTKANYIDVQQLVRGVLKSIGYDNPEYGIDYESCAVLSTIHEQSPDIAQGINVGEGLHKEQGAGDQGMMVGYACTDTPELMPAPIYYCHRIMERASEVRKGGILPFLRPDGKCQLTVEYRSGRPSKMKTVVLSHQHDDIRYSTLQEGLIEEVIKKAIPKELLPDDVTYHINPTGKFIVGGPKGDTGLTGRKIIVDTYGGSAAHGGGAFSGKDPTKVDRSAAYMMRYVAKNIVAAGIAEICEVQVSYAIGVSEPTSLYVNTHETGKVPDDKIEKAIAEVFDLTPAAIIRALDLTKPIYRETASHGHFGRSQFSWEKTDKVKELKNSLG